MTAISTRTSGDLDREVVDSYPTQRAAEHAVSYLADHGFPVDRAAIVGSDLRLVESVLGRVTRAKATVGGLAGGIWLGALTGLLLSVFSVIRYSPLAMMLGGVAYGAVFGAALGFIMFATDRNHRSFAATSTVVAARYDVVVDPEVAEEARNLLIKQSWREAP